MDPLRTSDGRPFAPVRFKEIANEKYLVTKFCNTSYEDVSKMTPKEREYLLGFILQDLQREQEARQKHK